MYILRMLLKDRRSIEGENSRDISGEIVLNKSNWRRICQDRLDRSFGRAFHFARDYSVKINFPASKRNARAF